LAELRLGVGFEPTDEKVVGRILIVLVKSVGSRISDVRQEDGILGRPLGLRYVPKLLLFRL
jgi:hypothetical protein